MLCVRTPLRRNVLDKTLSDDVCQCLATGRWFSQGTPFSSTNNTYRHDMHVAEIAKPDAYRQYEIFNTNKY